MVGHCFAWTDSITETPSFVGQIDTTAPIAAGCGTLDGRIRHRSVVRRSNSVARSSRRSGPTASAAGSVSRSIHLSHQKHPRSVWVTYNYNCDVDDPGRRLRSAPRVA